MRAIALSSDGPGAGWTRTHGAARRAGAKGAEQPEDAGPRVPNGAGSEAPSTTDAIFPVHGLQAGGYVCMAYRRAAASGRLRGLAWTGTTRDD